MSMTLKIQNLLDTLLLTETLKHNGQVLFKILYKCTEAKKGP